MGTDTTHDAEYDDADATTEEHRFDPRVTGGLPAPRQAPARQHWTGSWPQPVAQQTGSWSSAAYYGDEEETPREGNGAAVTSCVLAILGLLLSLRPLVFGSNAMTPDTYVALAVSVLALVLGVVGARVPARRAVAVTGIALSLAAFLLVAVIPTL